MNMDMKNTENLKNVKFLFIQLGCSKNRVDGEIMISSLCEKGAVPVDSEEKADVIIINTCGFIEDAKKEAIEEILSAIATGKKVIVTGCLAQRYKEEIFENFPEIYGVVGVFDTDKIAECVENAVKCQKREYFDSNKAPVCGDVRSRVLTTPFYYSFLKIADGCSNGCSYCTIPKIRGKYVSEPLEKLVREAKILSANGVTELIVVAQDTSRYGLDLYREKKLVSLLKRLDKIGGIKWIRLHYLYPEAITDEMIDFIAGSKKVLPYFDIPIQHINDNVLARMNRKVTKQDIITLLRKIKTKIPNSIIRTSLISGFPTETLEDHWELLDFVKQGWFDRLGVFPYSAEEGTKANSIKIKVKKGERKRRASEIMEAQMKVSLQKNKQKKGKEYEVLVEGVDTVNNIYFGRTYMDSPEIDGTVYFTAQNEPEIGDYVRVKITDCDEYDLTGEQVSE